MVLSLEVNGEILDLKDLEKFAMSNKPRSGIVGEWDRLTPKMKIVAAILIITPMIFYPPSALLFLAYAVLLNIRDRRNKG